MILSSNWIRERYKILIAVLKELVLFLIIYLIFYGYVNFGIFYYLFIIWWIFISYILGRYHAESRNISQFISKNLYHLTLIIILTTFFLFFKKNINSEEIITTYEKILPLIIFLSFAIHSYSDYKNIFKKEKKYNLIFIGESDLYNKFREEINRNFFKFKIKYFQSSDDYYKKQTSDSLDHIIISQSSITDKEIFNNLIKESKKVLKIIDWCEEFLVRYPSSLLTDNDAFDFNLLSKKHKTQKRLKRIMDLLFSVILLILSTPILIISAFLIYLEDHGPILYSQIRTGYRGKEIKIWKLRTMIKNAESSGAKWAKRNDNRITKVGHILRKTRIDELPQLLNIIKGDMSLIGPRPERPEFDNLLSKEIPYYDLRSFIRPGLSGWAQVNYPYGASKKDAENKLSYDLYYLRNFSLFLDMIIFFKTIRLVLNAKGSQPIK